MLRFSLAKSMVLTLIFCMLFVSFAPGNALACASCYKNVDRAESDKWNVDDGETFVRLTDHMTSELTAQKVWIVSILWEDNILPALMFMSEQLTTVAMHQMQIIGSFLDAKNQMETQQSLQVLRARAHKDYHPSIGMCEFGSGAKSLAASERKSELNALVMSQRAQDRNLGNAFTSAAMGEGADKPNRLRQFRETFCDPTDNNNGLSALCRHGGGIGAQDPERMNKDIDFARTVSFPWTLNVDFTDGAEEPSASEEDVLALASNLYGHFVFTRPTNLASGSGDAFLSAQQKAYMDARSLLAKRSVAENSFNAITGMKSAGTAGSREYLKAVLTELGVEAEQANLMLGGAGAVGESGQPVNPSYYAQMEILTKKMLQNPDFYTNLYDKPANVERKGAALQAIALMQKFDLFRSYLRNEASISVLLELAVNDLQKEMENEYGKISGAN